MRLIDADALIAEWYKLNNIGPEDCGARFVGYQEIARLINNAPTVSGQGDYIKRADAIEAVCRTRCGDKAKGCPAHSCLVIEEFDALPSADATPKMTEEVREAIMRLTMCAREECAMCKYKDKCGFEFQYNISTENMNTILEALSADAVQGEWKDKEVFNDTDDDHIVEEWQSARCSVCGKYHTTPYMYYFDDFNYCPNCGARMKAR